MDPTTEVYLRDSALGDIERFSKMHNWYKNLPYKGVSYLIFPWKGQQPRNVIDLKVDDPDKWHWWIWLADFIDEIPIDGIGKDIIMRNAVDFNCFFRGLDGDPSNHYLRGMSIIRLKNPDVEKNLEMRYSRSASPEAFAVLEHERQVSLAVNAAHKIYDLMSISCPKWLSPIEQSFKPSPRKHNSIPLQKFKSEQIVTTQKATYTFHRPSSVISPRCK